KKGRNVDVRPGYLKYPAGSHIVYFRNRGDRIDIIRILHGRMDAQRHL
ncbi:type II toxin-antitoxin system RelE/ParE family toxin, partial [Sinorhizobium meliloti]|nr:type II toxin-antitoxin system RelE/ParE family toxin [Sinorhizobium meliloti]